MAWIREAKRISARPGDDSSFTFTLPTHTDANFTAHQSAEAIADYFSQISQEYTLIEEDSSAPWLEAQKKIYTDECNHPAIIEHQVLRKYVSIKENGLYPRRHSSSNPEGVSTRVCRPCDCNLKISSFNSHLAGEL